MIIDFLCSMFLCFAIYLVYYDGKNAKIENEILELKKKKELVDYERFKSRHQFIKDVFDLEEE